MRNLTEDVILSGREANRFMESMLHPNRESIERREEFIHSGNFRTEERNGAYFIQDDGLDLSFLEGLNDSKDESSVTLDNGMPYNANDREQVDIDYLCTKYEVRYDEDLLATIRNFLSMGNDFDKKINVTVILDEEEKGSLRISKEEISKEDIKCDENMPDLRFAA